MNLIIKIVKADKKHNTNGTNGRMTTKETNKSKDLDGIIHKELSYKIVQACYEVHNVLGPGYSEKIYEEAMERELTSQGVSVDRQKDRGRNV